MVISAPTVPTHGVGEGNVEQVVVSCHESLHDVSQCCQTDKMAGTHQHLVVHINTWWYTSTPGGTHQCLVVHINAWWYTSMPGGTHQHLVVHINTWWYTSTPGGTHQCLVVHINAWWYTSMPGGTHQHLVVHINAWWYTSTPGGTHQHLVVHTLVLKEHVLLEIVLVGLYISYNSALQVYEKSYCAWNIATDSCTVLYLCK